MLKAWLRLSRPEFHTVGVFPLITGVVLGYVNGGMAPLSAILLALAATILIMLATYWSGEVYDYEVDVLSAQREKNKFSGGTLVLQQGGVPREAAWKGAIVAFLLAVLVGVLLVTVYDYGWELFLIGAIGGFMGFFYTTPPFRWAYRGIGEIFIAIAYGWLPIAVGYYLATRAFDWNLIWLIGTPVAISIFQVILINEFPDYPADREVGKKNLVVRLGREKAAILYGIATLLFILSVVMPAAKGHRPFYLTLPFALLAIINGIEVVSGRWRDRQRLEQLCARTLIVNLGTTIALAIGLWLWGI